MATIHLNYLTGNDTTGDGSASLPYKTLVKGFASVVDGDTIKVAGGQFTQLAGTVTVSARGTTMTTSTDLTGSLAVKDIIALDTQSSDGYTLEKSLFVVSSITSTTITLVGQQIFTKSGTYNIYKMSTIHYASTITSGAQETITTPTANNVLVSGGWNNDFTVQHGWTAANFGTTGSSTTANLLSISNWGTKSGIVFDKFLISQGGFCANSSATGIGINTVIFTTTNVSFGTSNFGVWAPTGGVDFTTLIACNAAINATWNGAANRPDTLRLKQWISAGSTSHTFKVGVNLNDGLATGPQIRTLEGYWRTAGSSNNISSYRPITLSTSQGDVFIDYLKLTLNGIDMLTPLVVPSASGLREVSWRYIGDVDVDAVTNSYIAPNDQIDTNDADYYIPININRSSGPIEALPWGQFGQRETISQWYKLGATTYWGKDTEGQKVINNDGIPKWADTVNYVTGTNSLRMKVVPNVNNTWFNSYICATLTKPNTSFTVTIKAKATKTISVLSTRLLYGPASSQEADLGTITLTTAWQDFTFSVNPATYSTWNLGDDGLMAIMLRILSSETAIGANDYIWIDSVTVA